MLKYEHNIGYIELQSSHFRSCNVISHHDKYSTTLVCDYFPYNYTGKCGLLMRIIGE